MKISRMKGMSPLLSICHLASCFSASISLRTSHRQHLRKHQYRRYAFFALGNFFHSSYTVEPPSAFAGAGNSLSGRPAGSSSQSKGKAKATADTEAKKAADGATWGSGQGRSLGSRPTNGVGARTFGAGGLVGVGGASIPRPPLRSGRKPPGRERSPTPDYGVDDDDDVIVIDSDVD